MPVSAVTSVLPGKTALDAGRNHSWQAHAVTSVRRNGFRKAAEQRHEARGDEPEQHRPEDRRPRLGRVAGCGDRGLEDEPPDPVVEPHRDLGDDRADDGIGGREAQGGHQVGHRRRQPQPRSACSTSPAAYERNSSRWMASGRLQPSEGAHRHGEEREVARDHDHRHPALPARTTRTRGANPSCG